jgi:hypothetical protein
VPDRAVRPFMFVECMELKQILGLRASDEKQLADVLQEVPLDSVYYHTHGVFLRNKSIAGVYPNDFAWWAATQVRDQALAERLAVLDPFDYSRLEDLREEILSVIDDHLSRLQFIPRVVYGDPFDFIQSRIVQVPTGHEARNLLELRNLLSDVDVSAVYFHFIEARVRLREGRSDFAVWLEETLGLQQLAARIDLINPYGESLERLRSEILTNFDEALQRGEHGDAGQP